MPVSRHTLERQAIARASINGFSLVELLIAMVLGLMLTLAMISVFSGNRRSADLNTAIANLQESARFALDSISGDVRMAGFQGCTPMVGGSVNVLASDAPITDTTAGLSSTALWGSRIQANNVWSPMPPWGAGPGGFSVPTANPAIAGTQALALQFGDPKAYNLSQPIGGNGNATASGLIYVEGVHLDKVDNLSVGDLAIVSDCVGGDLFRVTSVGPSGSSTVIGHAASASGNVTGSLTNIYGKTRAARRQSLVMRFNARIFYVGDTGEVDEQGNTVTALYRQDAPFDGSSPAVEIVQGVEQFAVSFELTNSTGQRRTVPAGDATFRPDQVTAVRIGILMASEAPIAELADDSTYVLAGVEVPPADQAIAGQPSHAGDNRFRLAFNTTIKVRNFRDNGN